VVSIFSRKVFDPAKFLGTPYLWGIGLYRWVCDKTCLCVANGLPTRTLWIRSSWIWTVILVI